MRSMAYSNTAKPKRPECPRCSKKGIGIWHGVENWQGITDFRSRNCRYCGWTEFQTYVFERDFSGSWQETIEDKARKESYNGTRTNYPF